MYSFYLHACSKTTSEFLLTCLQYNLQAMENKCGFTVIVFQIAKQCWLNVLFIYLYLFFIPRKIATLVFFFSFYCCMTFIRDSYNENG